MGAFTGPITASAYRVLGIPKDWNHVFDEMTRSRFKDLRPGNDKDRSVGWVLGDDPFSTDFSRATLFRGEILVLTLRMDVLSVPAGQLKLHTEKAVADRLKKEGRDRLNRKEQEELGNGREQEWSFENESFAGTVIPCFLGEDGTVLITPITITNSLSPRYRGRILSGVLEARVCSRRPGDYVSVVYCL